MKIGDLFRRINTIELQDVVLVLCGIVAIVLSVLSFTNNLPIGNDNISQITLGAVGMLFLLVMTIGQKIDKAKKPLSIDEVSYLYDYEEDIEAHFLHAETLDIYGIELSKDLDRYYTKILKLAESNKTINVLLADPDGSVIDMVNKRYPTNKSACRENISASVTLLMDIKKKTNGKIEIRMLDYLFPRNAYIFNKARSNSISFVQNYTYRLAAEKAKCVYRRGKSNHFDFILNEYELMWGSSDAYVEKKNDSDQ